MPAPALAFASSGGAEFETLHFDKRARSLGNGGFGTVSVASLGGVQVAVKRLNNQNVRMHLLEEMRRDIQSYHALQVRVGGGGGAAGGIRSWTWLWGFCVVCF